MKCKCGLELTGRAQRCEVCKEKIRMAREAKMKAENIKIVKICLACKEKLVSGPYADYCADCCKKLRTEAIKAKYGIFSKDKKEKVTAVAADRPPWPEPKGDKNSLEHVVWELECVNNELRAKGKPTLTYGQYSMTRKHMENSAREPQKKR